jgi:hypothetical protein
MRTEGKPVPNSAEPANGNIRRVITIPPATLCWEVAEPRCTICVFDFGSTLMLALTRDPDESPAYTGAEKESEAHA